MSYKNGSKQCAAVKTWRDVINDPPVYGLWLVKGPFQISKICEKNAFLYHIWKWFHSHFCTQARLTRDIDLNVCSKCKSNFIPKKKKIECQFEIITMCCWSTTNNPWIKHFCLSTSFSWCEQTTAVAFEWLLLWRWQRKCFHVQTKFGQRIEKCFRNI